MSKHEPEYPTEKSVSYTTREPYFTLGSPRQGSGNTWVVFHGIGQLARYFLRNFTHLDLTRNYVLAPQAPSLYYTSDTYDRVGASWLTRENTASQMENLLAYLDGMAAEEGLKECNNLIVFGYSQGVSVLCRWVARRRITCKRIILYAGRVPSELSSGDFEHLPESCRVELYHGDSDPMADKWGRKELADHARAVFGSRLEIVNYRGGHEIQRKWIREK